MRNSIKNIECGDHTYSMFFEGVNLTEGGGQYGFAVDETEVRNVTPDTSFAMKIFDKISNGKVSPIHLRDVIEDMVTEKAML